MSLRDLKKSTQSNSTQEASNIDLETFIEGAQSYAYGLDSQVKPMTMDGKCRNATFSLTPQSTSELSGISKRTGITKSRLLRILVHDQYFSDDQWLFAQNVS